VECGRGGDRGLPPETPAGGGRFFDSAPLPCHQVTRENAASASPPTAPMRSAPRRTATGPRRRRGSRKGTSDARLRFGCPMSRFGPPPGVQDTAHSPHRRPHGARRFRVAAHRQALRHLRRAIIENRTVAAAPAAGSGRMATKPSPRPAGLSPPPTMVLPSALTPRAFCSVQPVKSKP